MDLNNKATMLAASMFKRKLNCYVHLESTIKEKSVIFKSKVLVGGQIRDETVLFIVVCGLIAESSLVGGAHALGGTGFSSNSVWASVVWCRLSSCGAQA